MGRIGSMLPIAGILLLVFAVSGCKQLFTTSLGKELGLVRPMKLPDNLSAQQVSDLVAQAKEGGDTKLATALVSKLTSQIESLPAGSSAAKIELQTAAASAAIVASGASEKLLPTLMAAVSNGTIPTQAEIVALVQTLSGTSTEIITALQYLNPNGGVPTASISGTSSVNATDYLIAAVIVAASSPAIPTGSDSTTLTAAQLAALQADSVIQSAAQIATAGGTVLTASGNTQSQSLVDQFTAFLGSH